MESTPSTWLLHSIICHSLKVVDFLSMTAANRRKGPSTVDKGWYQVAWAFLKVSFMVPGASIVRQTVGHLSGFWCSGPSSTIKIYHVKNFLPLTVPYYLISSRILSALGSRSALGFCRLLKDRSLKKMGKTPSSHIIHSLGGEYC